MEDVPSGTLIFPAPDVLPRVKKDQSLSLTFMESVPVVGLSVFPHPLIYPDPGPRLRGERRAGILLPPELRGALSGQMLIMAGAKVPFRDHRFPEEILQFLLSLFPILFSIKFSTSYIMK